MRIATSGVTLFKTIVGRHYYFARTAADVGPAFQALQTPSGSLNRSLGRLWLVRRCAHCAGALLRSLRWVRWLRSSTRLPSSRTAK